METAVYFVDRDMIIIKDTAAELLDSLAGFKLSYIDKWGDLKNA
jgi:hypothetical protein